MKNETPAEQFGSFLVIASSIVAAVLAGSIAALIASTIVGGGTGGAILGVCLFVIVALITGFGYPLLGAIIVPLCEELRRWAYPQEQLTTWSRGERIIIGALWPLTAPALMILYIFLGIISRAY